MIKSAGIIRRARTQWILAWIVILTIGLGWKFPLIGLTVPVVMLTGIIGGFFRGRWVCGNVCPRGGFFDRYMALISGDKQIPEFFRGMVFRWTLFAALMGFMGFRLMQNPSDINHWGSTFWMMCVVTTAVGVVLAIFVHPRTWCSFCPIGTVQNAVGGAKDPLLIDSAMCRECGICEGACPAGLEIVKYKAHGKLKDRDCIKCSECIDVCPCKALVWQHDRKVA